MPFSTYWVTSPLIAMFLLAGCTTSKPIPPVPQSARPVPSAFKSPLFADLDQFHRILFLNDMNGSMINTAAILKDELQKAVESLSDQQSFNVVFFQNQWFGREAAQATVATKKKCKLYLETVTAGGTTDPLCCLEEAFREKPDVIYLLGDGFPDNQALLKRIHELDKDRKVKVYTIAFMDGNMVDADFDDFMKKIADETGGKFRRVNAGAL
ncbi:MAG TPA: hypothetical protein VFE47_12160 [Tepidisphaeraceae bacterium]|jgi:uncharacterized protein with von Willebrand factor type A (vWA) domain|nr:hypothetical protein [Tepidisphaeraceae bacterium]